MLAGNKGFTILEVVIGAAVFLIGMLGVIGLQLSAIRAEAFSARMTEATLMARSTFEELMTYNYTDSRLDDDDCSGWDGTANAPPCDGSPSFSTDVDMPTTSKNADLLPVGPPAGNKIPDAYEIADEKYPIPTGHVGLGTNEIFKVGYSVCEDCLLDDTKSVRVIVYWRLKGDFQSVDFYGVIPRQ